MRREAHRGGNQHPIWITEIRPDCLFLQPKRCQDDRGGYKLRSRRLVPVLALAAVTLRPQEAHSKPGERTVTPHIQNESPDTAGKSNWLPPPAGWSYLVMRLYRPETTPHSMLPIGQGTRQPPGLMRAV
jgi:hypothetical protein